MFRQFFSIVTCAALLAACGGNNTINPTAVVQQNAPTTSAELTPTKVVPTNGPREYGTEGLQLPQTGTIIPPEVQDPEAGLLFDSVALNRMGGIAGVELNVVITKDGNVTRDGVSSTIPSDQVKLISDKLDQIGFFGMQGVFQAAGTSADVFTYRLSAERNGSSRTVTAQDGFIPPQLADLLQIVSEVGSTK